MKQPKLVARQVRARPLAVFSLVFLGGILLENRWALPLNWLAVGAGCALIVGIALLRFKKRGVALCATALALCLGALRMGAALGAIPAIETQYSAEMVGEVVSAPFTNANGRLVSQFHLTRVNGEDANLRLRLYLRGDAAAMADVDCGQTLALKGHIWACDPVTNPYEFDFGAYLRRDGMAGFATATIDDVVILDARESALTAVVRVRRALAARIDTLFPRNAGLARALLLGDRSLLGDEMRDALKATGTAHLIAISGLHVSVLALAVSALLGRFTSRRVSGAITFALLLLYGALIGFGAPFVRAMVMFGVYELARWPGLPTESLNRLGAAMLLLLLIRPMEALDSGFAMSFGAVAGIALLSKPVASLLHMERWLTGLSRAGVFRAVRRYFCGLVVASISAQLAILPAVIASFGTQSVISLPVNLLCVPLCMAGYIAAMIAMVLSAVWLPLGRAVGQAAELLFSALTAITHWSAALPVTSLRIGRYPWWLIAAHIVLLAACSGLSRTPLRKRRWLAVALIGVAGLSSLNTAARAWPFSVIFLDAEQADCTVLRTRGHTYVFDAGDTYTPAADYLSATCLHLDGVFLSHPHQDHAGGLREILALFKPDAIYIPVGWDAQEIASEAVVDGLAQARAMGVPIVELAAGDAVRLSKSASLTVYAPDAARLPDNVNDLSMLALVRCEGQSVLFTGDLTMNGEPEAVPDADILKVAHHGSKDATSARFLAAATPDIAVISVGENHFGHPSDEALERLRASGAQIYQTLRDGAIELTYFHGAWRVKTYLEAEHELE